MTETTLEQIYKKLNDIDLKVTALMVKEEKPTKEELRAIRAGQKQFAEGKFSEWKDIRHVHG